MHSVLEDYTSSYTTSETPFIAWVTVMARRYHPHKFISDKRFRSIWFAYAGLLQLNEDMVCPICGPTPKVTIWDGVTLAFGRRHVLPTLHPPTTIVKNAPQRSNTRYPIKPQHLQDKDLRKNLRFVLNGGFGAVADGTLQQRLLKIPGITKDLSSVNACLGVMFKRCYDITALKSHAFQEEMVYKELFLQIAAEESALQMTPRPILKCLEEFLQEPTLENNRHLTMIPALYNVILLEMNGGDQARIRTDTFGLCKWLLARGSEVLSSMLSGKEKAIKDVQPGDIPGGWKQVGFPFSHEIDVMH